MLDKEVYDWIASEESKGYSKEQISYFLSQKGYSQEEIYNALNHPINASRPKDHITKHANKHFGMIIIALVLIILLSAGIFYYLSIANENAGVDEESVSQTNTQAENNPSQNQIPDQELNSENKNSEDNLESDTNQCEGIIDCESANPINDCFIKAAKDCCPAKLKATLTVDFFGVEVTNTMQREIKGLEDDLCILRDEITASQTKFSSDLIEMMQESGLSNEEILKQEQETQAEGKAMIGKDSICKYPIPDLVETLENEKEGEYFTSTEDENKYDCTGSLYQTGEEEVIHQAEGVNVN